MSFCFISDRSNQLLNPRRPKVFGTHNKILTVATYESEDILENVCLHSFRIVYTVTMATFSKDDSFLETILLLSIIHRKIYNLDENFSKTSHKIAQVFLV